MRTKDFRKKYENIAWEAKREAYHLCAVLNNKLPGNTENAGYKFFFLKTQPLNVDGKDVRFREVDAVFSSNVFDFFVYEEGKQVKITDFELVLNLLDLLRKEYKSIGNRRRLYGYRHNN